MKAIKKELTRKQKILMKEHAVHHTAKHMADMTKLMLAGMPFADAHKEVMKKSGK